MMESSSFQPSVRRTTMKMAWVSVAWVFLLCCSAVASQACDEYGAKGQNFNIPLGYTLKSTDGLKWKFKTKTIIYMKAGKVLSKDGGETHPNGSLKLTNLNKEQEGLYTSEVYDENGKKTHMKERQLCILDPVKKPTTNVTCEDPYAVFECPLKNQPKGAKYEWLQNGVKMKKIENPLKVKAAETRDDKFVCRVFNDASSESSKPISHSCAKTGAPPCPIPIDGITDELCWGMVGGGGGIVLLLMIIVIVCCVRTKRTRKLRLQDEEELRLEWTNTSQHPSHPPLPDHPPPHHPSRHHHHHQQQQQQQAPGNTGPRQSRSKQNRQPRARAPEPNGQPQPSPRRTGQPQKPASDADDEQPPPLPQPRKKGPKTQLD